MNDPGFKHAIYLQQKIQTNSLFSIYSDPTFFRFDKKKIFLLNKMNYFIFTLDPDDIKAT